MIHKNMKSFEEHSSEPMISVSLNENQLNEIIYHLHEYGSMIDKYCYGLPTGEADMKEMRQLIIDVIEYNK